MSSSATALETSNPTTQTNCDRRKQKTYRYNNHEHNPDSLEENFVWFSLNLAEFEIKGGTENVCCLARMNYYPD